MTSDFKNQTLKTLINQEQGVKPIPKGFDNFVEAVKLIMDWGQDIDNGFTITFNSDYSKIKKLKITW